MATARIKIYGFPQLSEYIEQKLLEFSSDLSETESRIDGVLATISDKDSEIALIKTDIESIRSDIDNELNEITQFAENIESIISEKEAIINQLGTDIAEAKAKLEKVQPQLANPYFVIDSANKMVQLKRSSGNVIQGVWKDTKGKGAYACWVSSDELHIAYYGVLPYRWGWVNPSWEINTGKYGHQQLTGYYKPDGSRWLIVSAHEGKFWMFQISSESLVDSREITAYGDDGGHVTCGISKCGKWFITEGYIGDDRQVVSIYPVSILDTLNDGDSIAGQAIIEFDIERLDSTAYPLQGVAMDSGFIYIAYGNGDEADANFIRTFDIDGNLVNETILTFGNESDNDKYEQEGLFWMNNHLCSVIATGEDGNNTITLYEISDRFNYGRTARTDTSSPPDDLLTYKEFPGDNAGSFDRIYARGSRVDEVATLDVKMWFSGLNGAFPTDNKTQVDLSVSALFNFVGCCYNREGGIAGLAVIKYYKDGGDLPIYPAEVFINGDTLTIYNGEHATYNSIDDVTNCEITFKITFKVS